MRRGDGRVWGLGWRYGICYDYSCYFQQTLLVLYIYIYDDVECCHHAGHVCCCVSTAAISFFVVVYCCFSRFTVKFRVEVLGLPNFFYHI